mgnify:CR=1 FL=1
MFGFRSQGAWLAEVLDHSLPPTQWRSHLSFGSAVWGDGKWVYMDPNANRWVPGDDGVPLSVAEVRRKIFTSPGGFPACYGTSPARKMWSGDKRFVVIGYHPNTNLLDQPFDYDKMYVIVDEFSGTRKDVRGKGDPVKDPLVDPNFPINQASLRLEAAESGLAVRVRTMTPNFKAFRCRVDGGLDGGEMGGSPAGGAAVVVVVHPHNRRAVCARCQHTHHHDQPYITLTHSTVSFS